MKEAPDSASRRAGLAAAMTLALGSLARANDAQAGAGESIMQPDKCCGNGPPDTARYGLGLEIRPLTFTDRGQTFEFKNQRFGDLEDKTWYWVFAVAANIPQVSYYKIKNGNIVAPKFWDITTPVVARVYAVESGFALDLSWPTTRDPRAFARRIDE